MFRNCPGGRANAAGADLLKKKLPNWRRSRPVTVRYYFSITICFLE